MEKRAHPRIKKKLPLKLLDKNFDIVAETENISCSGAYCQIDRPLAPMTKMNIAMLLPIRHQNKTITKKIECKGVVVRAEQPQLTKDNQIYRIAIFFNEIKESDRERITKYIDEHLTKEEYS